MTAPTTPPPQPQYDPASEALATFFDCPHRAGVMCLPCAKTLAARAYEAGGKQGQRGWERARRAEQIAAALVVAAGGEIRVDSGILLIADQIDLASICDPRTSQDVFMARIPPHLRPHAAGSGALRDRLAAAEKERDEAYGTLRRVEAAALGESAPADPMTCGPVQAVLTLRADHDGYKRAWQAAESRLAAAEQERDEAKALLRQTQAVNEMFVREYVRHPEEYLKWQRGERHRCLSCGKAEPFNGCSALCPECLPPKEKTP